MKKGVLLVISGPSGSGKGTILDIIKKDKNISVAVSATTRKPRSGEIDGVHYHFMSRERFLDQIATNNILEYNEYCGNLYGTMRSEIESNLNRGKSVILEIDVNGAQKISDSMDCVKIFILPPNIETLKERLFLRGTETRESIKNRIDQAYKEIEKACYYDYIVVNAVLDEAVEKIRSILDIEILKKNRIKINIDNSI